MRVARKVEEVPLIFLIEVIAKGSEDFLEVKNFGNFEGVLVLQCFEFFKFSSKIFFGFAKFVFCSPKVL